ncbi:MAG: restriction endonuclease subunit S, partial [Nanoarchaeota archaeon]
SIKIVIPPESFLKKADKIFHNIFKRRLIIENEILSLQKTRDLLLPKLMTGKIRVPLEVEE